MPFDEKILIAGGAGFIGSHLVDFFLSRKMEVIVLDNFSSGLRENLPEDDDNLMVIPCDVSEILPEIPFEIETIFHLASITCPSVVESNSDDVFRVNEIGSRNLLELAYKKNARIVFASNAEIYWLDKYRKQIKEMGESDAWHSSLRCLYLDAKKVAEKVLIDWWRISGVDCRIVRFFDVFGPKMNLTTSIYSQEISNFIETAKKNESIIIQGNGSQVKRFCWIEDVVEALYLAASSEELQSTFNIERFDTISILDLAKIIIKLTGSKSRIYFRRKEIDDNIWTYPDTSFDEELLESNTGVSIQEGLKILLKGGELQFDQLVDIFTKIEKLKELLKWKRDI